MIELNKYLINKMGWMNYSSSRGISLNNTILYEDDPLVRHFFIDNERKILFVIKELSNNEKQNSNKSYKFLIIEYDKLSLKSNTKIRKKLKFKVYEFDSNSELYKLVIENEACNGEYQRHFRISKLLKK